MMGCFRKHAIPALPEPRITELRPPEFGGRERSLRNGHVKQEARLGTEDFNSQAEPLPAPTLRRFFFWGEGAPPEVRRKEKIESSPVGPTYD